MKKQVKKSFKKIRFLFERGFYLELPLDTGETSTEIMYMGAPVTISHSGETVSVNIQEWLLEVHERYKNK